VALTRWLGWDVWSRLREDDRTSVGAHLQVSYLLHYRADPPFLEMTARHLSPFFRRWTKLRKAVREKDLHIIVKPQALLS
jgi:hypothetical protein